MRVRVLLSAAVLGVGAVLAAAMWNRSAYAQYRRMSAAVKDVRSAHIVMWLRDGPQRRKRANETWYEAGRWRMEGPGSLPQIYAGGKLYRYDPRADVVTRHDRPDGPFAFNPSGFTLDAMVQDADRWEWKDRFSLLGASVLNGRPVRQVLMEKPDFPERTFFLIDAASNLPVRAEVQVKEGAGNWETRGWVTFDFNRVLPGRLFDPHTFSKAARFLDKSQTDEAIRKRYARGIARKRVGRRAVVLHDMEANREGDVFLLFNAGPRLDPPAAWSDAFHNRERAYAVAVTDDRGTKYLGGNVFLEHDPYARRERGTPPRPLSEDGPVEFDHWFPLQPQGNWKPRTLTFTFTFRPGLKENGKPAPEAGKTVAFTIPVASPRTGDLPNDWKKLVPEWEDLRFVNFSKELLDYGHLQAREFYHEERHESDQALKFHRDLVRLAESQNPKAGGMELLNMAGYLKFIGRRGEARDAYEKAAAKGGFSERMAREELSRLDGSARLMVKEIREPAALLLKLRDETDPLSAWLRSRLSPELLAGLKHYDGAKESRELLRLRDLLLADLNRLIEGPSLYDPERFGGVVLKAKTRELLNSNPSGKELERLNRSLLEDAYPGEISRM